MEISLNGTEGLSKTWLIIITGLKFGWMNNFVQQFKTNIFVRRKSLKFWSNQIKKRECFCTKHSRFSIDFPKDLEIESHTETDLSLTERSTRNEEVGSGVVDKRRAEIEDRRVENVIEFNNRTQTHSFGEAKFSRNIQIEGIKTRTSARIARQVPAASADRRKRELIEQRLIESAGLLPDDIGNVAGKIRTVGAEVVEVAVDAADADAERCGAAGAEERRKAQFAEPPRRIERA